MRILYASFDEVPSYKGASTHILASSRRTVRAHELHLVTLGQTALPRFDGLHHHPQALAEPNYLRRGLEFRGRVRTLAERVRPDVAHFRSPWEGLALLEAGVPCLYEVNGLASLELRELYGELPHQVTATLSAGERTCLRGARAIVCPSERIRDHLLGLDATLAPKIRVVPNGYDLVPIPARIAADRVRLVYLGTLHPWQGLFRMLRAFTRLTDVCTLDIYAPPHRSWTPMLHRRIARHGLGSVVRIHAPLHRLALARTLPTYDAGIAPLRKNERNTVQGCHPVKLLDYLSHGLPVIGPDLFVVRQTVHNDENGVLYEPDDDDAFVEAVRSLVDRPRLARLQAAAQPSLAAHPTWDEHASRITALYDELKSAA